MPRISCFQEMPEVWFQEALERMLGRTMCVLDGAVLLHAHPIYRPGPKTEMGSLYWQEALRKMPLDTFGLIP